MSIYVGYIFGNSTGMSAVCISTDKKEVEKYLSSYSEDCFPYIKQYRLSKIHPCLVNLDSDDVSYECAQKYSI